ncbi:MAG: SBBP repeat-containing protein [Flammeovirgaceae bacterium]|nr:MAG: SBBP repeat-containing protein [Flammeovirgaceae bacterium]
MTSDANGNIYLVGAFTGTINFGSGASAGPAVGSDIWFGKFSSTGSLIWAHGLIGGDDDFGWDIALDNSGNVYITGYFGTTTSQLDFDPGAGTAFPTVSHGLFFAKYNNSGVFQWVKTIGTNFVTTRSHGIAIDNSSNVYIAGTIWSSTPQNIDFNPGTGVNNLSTNNGSIFYAKYNSSGNYLWAKNVGPGNTASTECRDLFLDGSNNVYITGTFNGSADFHPSSTSPVLNSSAGAAYVCKYNSSGNYIWTKQVGGQNGDWGNRVVVDGSNNVYVTGTYNTNGQNIFLAKFNSSGTQQILKSIGGTNSDAGHALTLDGSGNLYLTGFFNGTNVEFNPGGSQKALTSNGSFHNFFYGKYALSNLSCQWVRRVDFNLDAPDYEMNAIRLVNNKLVIAGNFKGSGDFNSCAESSVFNASTLDGFLIGHNTADGPLSITGPNTVCNQGTFVFSAQNVPPDAVVQWTTTPGNLLNPSSGTGPTFTTNAVAGVSGSVTVSASVLGECAGNASMPIWVGIPQPITSMQITIEPCETLQAIALGSNASSYNWYINGVFFTSTSNNTVEISLITQITTPGWYTISTEGVNICGVTQRYNQNVYIGCTGGAGRGQQYSVGYPNPTQYEINFVLEPGDKETVDFEYSYSLVDKNGATVKKGSTRKNVLVIDVSDLKKDTYIFKVQLPGQRIEQRIVIE